MTEEEQAAVLQWQREHAPRAQRLVAGRCNSGICIDMVADDGTMIAHAHGFDAVALWEWLGRLIVAEHGSESDQEKLRQAQLRAALEAAPVTGHRH